MYSLRFALDTIRLKDCRDFLVGRWAIRHRTNSLLQHVSVFKFLAKIISDPFFSTSTMSSCKFVTQKQLGI